MLPRRKRTVDDIGAFNPKKYKSPIYALQSILPYYDSMPSPEEYAELMAKTKSPTDPVISTEPLGVEETKNSSDMVMDS